MATNTKSKLHKPRQLTDSQKTFVDAKMRGATDHAAALAAGQSRAVNLTSSENVRQELEKARAEMRDLTKITRLEVIEGILDGVNIARFTADAGNVIKGWVEVAKILGLAAPEVRKIELSINQQKLRTKFEALSDTELLAIQEGLVINGEAKVVN